MNNDLRLTLCDNTVHDTIITHDLTGTNLENHVKSMIEEFIDENTLPTRRHQLLFGYEISNRENNDIISDVRIKGLIDYFNDDYKMIPTLFQFKDDFVSPIGEMTGMIKYLPGRSNGLTGLKKELVEQLCISTGQLTSKYVHTHLQKVYKKFYTPLSEAQKMYDNRIAAIQSLESNSCNIAAS